MTFTTYTIVAVEYGSRVRYTLTCPSREVLVAHCDGLLAMEGTTSVVAKSQDSRSARAVAYACSLGGHIYA